jgi:superfamily II DNA or RNA helicase
VSNSSNRVVGSIQGPQGFRKLGLKHTYNTGKYDLAREFFVPLLSYAVSYDRGVGYFSSGWLQVNAQGLAELAMRGGHARWVTSPLFSQQDIEVFSKIANLEKSPKHLKSLLKTVDELRTALENDTRNTMAWMVADELLEFRFAVPMGELIGDFHDKFGVFRDEFGQRVSFLGSYNDTVKGLRNYESIRVFFSWEASAAEAVEEDEQRFARIWLGREHNLRVFQLPEAVREGILALRTDDRPYPKPEPHRLSTVSLPGIFPRTYQEKAIEQWEKNERRGILDMATGTGKTIVALTAITRCAAVGFIVIGAPTNSLVTQWLGELEKLEGIHSPIEVSGNNPKWPEELLPRLRLAMAGGTRGRPFVFVGTYKSLSSDRFLATLNQIQPARGLGLLVADEVHNTGAATYQRLLNPNFDCRLGLTATLERAYDEEGTQVVEDYFEGVVYALGIEDAVGSILCRYHYDVRFVELTEAEFAKYQRLSLRIASLMSQPPSKDVQETPSGQPDELTILLNRRASIVKQAQAKFDSLAELVRQVSINKCLIYCADIEQVRAVQRLLTEAGISNLSYTSEESAFARQTALDQLRRNDVQAVVAVKCLDEGIDVPQVHQAILLASSTSEREFVQRRGRILRKVKGKQYAHLIDVFTIPPRQYYENPPTLLFNELKRARILARAADNRFEAENRLIEELSAFGVPIEQTLGA